MTRSKQTWLVAGGLVTAMVGLSAALAVRAIGAIKSQHDPPPPRSGVEQESQIAALEQATRSLEQQMNLMRLESHSIPSPAASASTEAPSAARPRREPLSQEEVRARAEQQLKVCEDLVDTEPRDPSWAPGFESELRKSITDTAGTQRIGDVSCRESICRFDVTHASLADQREFVQGYALNVPKCTAWHVMPSQTDDGAASTRIYLIREGYPVPQAPAASSASP